MFNSDDYFYFFLSTHRNSNTCLLYIFSKSSTASCLIYIPALLPYDNALLPLIIHLDVNVNPQRGVIRL